VSNNSAATLIKEALKSPTLQIGNNAVKGRQSTAFKENITNFSVRETAVQSVKNAQTTQESNLTCSVEKPQLPSEPQLHSSTSAHSSPALAHKHSSVSSQQSPTTCDVLLLKSPEIVSSPKTPNSSSPKIVDAHQLEQRQKQIDYGHQTLGYIRYRLLVPKEKRTRDDPRTPKKSQACSKRSWDGQIKKWRRDMHKWDPEDPAVFMSWLESDFVTQIIKNNIGPEVLELLQKVKERASKFEQSPDECSPSTPSPSISRVVVEDNDLDDEKIARKLVF